MFINYLKIAIRNFKKQKTYSFINVIGLTIGLSCSFLVLTYVIDELSYDRFHRIGRGGFAI
jgi:putative ABC transport system permease protein